MFFEQADQLAGVRENLNTLVHECIQHLGNVHQVAHIILSALAGNTGISFLCRLFLIF
jgi:hypothetical protein